MISTNSAKVHIYAIGEENSLPQHPGPDWTRFVCISDTHSKIFSVPAGDILLHAGDLSSWGRTTQLEKTIAWLASLDHSKKIIIAGNHDLCLDGQIRNKVLNEDDAVLDAIRTSMKSSATMNDNIYYLEHECLDVKVGERSWKIYGSPAAPLYARGAFQYSTDTEAKEVYSRIPDDIDILLTHTPPYMVLDETRRSKHAGCPILAERLMSLKSCRLHVFG
ncbi:Metallo-dependent phosphatase-like protein [Cyathus striatus]|nr:Metallo-dependent phosphatase-like protein [Cyathus striatus]